jgi:ABC-type polysaccharide/polyol phosphate export permease
VPVLLNCFLFASLGVFIALTIKTHRDMGFFTTFVITPMSFLSNTFFSLRRLPDFLVVLTKIIPLTHASITIRAVFLGYSIPVYHYLVLVGYGALFFLLAVRQVHRAVE